MPNNLKNTEATQFRTGSEQVEIARKGGLASGQSRRLLKTYKEALVAEMETVKGDVTGAQAVVRAMYAKACKGDVAAARLLLELSGELKQGVEIVNLQAVQLLPDGLDDKCRN